MLDLNSVFPTVGVVQFGSLVKLQFGVAGRNGTVLVAPDKLASIGVSGWGKKQERQSQQDHGQ